MINFFIYYYYMSENNLLNFIDEKIKNLKKLIYELTDNKEKIKDMEKNWKIDKWKILCALLIINDENKKEYVLKMMNECEIKNNEENYNKIVVYIDMLLDLKKEYFSE